MAKVRYEGVFEVNKPREYVYDFLTDPRNVVLVIPGVESVELTDQDSFKIKAVMGIGGIKGVVNITARFVEKKPPETAKVAGSGFGLQSTMNFELGFKLVETAQKTTSVSWYFNGNIGGLVGTMGGRVIDPIAKSMIQEGIQKLKDKLSQ